MAISKSAKIQAEIEKVTAKISEQQARLKELEQKKLEAENSEIVEIVRGMSVSLTDLPVLLQTIKSGGALGQNGRVDKVIYILVWAKKKRRHAASICVFYHPFQIHGRGRQETVVLRCLDTSS